MKTSLTTWDGELLLEDAPIGPVFAHSDAAKTLTLVRPFSNAQEALQSHLTRLGAICEGRQLWMPTFNYDFCKTGRFDLDQDPSQVGVITETFRCGTAEWRSPVPVFSISGVGKEPTMMGDSRSHFGLARAIDAFGQSSVFAELVQRDGLFLLYGTNFSSLTFIHQLESEAIGPLYRYEKMFEGFLTVSGHEEAICLRYHVRPLGRSLNYDWQRLEREIEQEGLLRNVGGNSTVRWVSAKELHQFWLDCLSSDPLHFLDLPSRSWVEPTLHQLGRRFELSDFEPES